MIELKFYTTAGCHLCDKALAIIKDVHRANPDVAVCIRLEAVDIAHDDELTEIYGTRIPVIAVVVDGEQQGNIELNYPFSHQDYVNFLNSI